MTTGWKNSKSIKAIIVFKTVLLLALWISMDNFYIGDRPSLAEETPATGDKATEKKEEKAAEPAKRKSFLDNLLNLPDLDVSTLKREEISRFLTLAERKKKQVDERLEMLKVREVQLTKIEQSIDEKLKKLEDERKYFAQTVQQEKELKGQRQDRLVELYDKMEPKKAAPVIEKMDKDLVVALFKSLKQKQVTTILEFMKPEKSVELSEYYGRVRSAREYDLLREMNVSLRKEFAECKGMTAPEELDPDTKQSTETEKKAAATPAATTPVAAAPAEASVTPNEKNQDAEIKSEGTEEKDIKEVAPATISAGSTTAADSDPTAAAPVTAAAEKSDPEKSTTENAPTTH